MTFTPLDLLIDSISFDLQIFPDGSCPSSGHCGRYQSNWPDFKLYVNDRSASSSPTETWLGMLPGTDDTYSHSPKHKFGDETAPQLLMTAMIDLDGLELTTLDFLVDIHIVAEPNWLFIVFRVLVDVADAHLDGIAQPLHVPTFRHLPNHGTPESFIAGRV